FAWSSLGVYGPAAAVDFGSQLLDAAAERGDEATYRAVREPLRRWTGRIADEAAREAYLRPAALADARMGEWGPFSAARGADGARDLREAAAVIEARRGDADAARRLLDMAGGRTVSRAAWHVARAGAEAQGDLADLLTWIYDLPDPASRCAAYL